LGTFFSKTHLATPVEVVLEVVEFVVDPLHLIKFEVDVCLERTS
jgi:hypothetical protein